MSYCQWSEGDVHAFASTAGGWMTCVAARRPLNVPRDAGARMLVNARYEEIDLPFAGCDFHDDRLEDFEARLYLLKRVGFVIPDRAFEMIAQERREASAGS
jgi:fermentation-respiration switch protein FrsA (DUF1100 family)